MSSFKGKQEQEKKGAIKDDTQNTNIIIVNSIVPKNRQELLKWNGWGYKDSKFIYENNQVSFTGTRYPIGELRLPNLVKWVKTNFNINFDKPIKAQQLPKENQLPQSNINNDILDKIKQLKISFSLKGIDRLIRAHGQTLNDIYTLRHSMFNRIPDIVLWPENHNDVIKIVNFANNNNLVIIPFGGGTAVSGAVNCPKNENRSIISLDTSQMNRILWLDKENLIANIESGILGQDLERELRKLGYTTGHEPDSYEFSSLGGWIATRASGMKKNLYGNIEDLIVNIKMVTPKGVLTKNCQVPRMSCGPDFNHIILGCEGSYGIITEVILKIRPLPKCRKFGSIIFPNFEYGVMCIRKIAKKRYQPASIRLMDNDQFKLGMILKPESDFINTIMDGIKKIYITKLKGFNINSMCIMTLLFEGDENDVKNHEKKLYNIGNEFNGIPSGQINGERGYMLTFVIAYIRDLALDYGIVAESFETSVPWDKCLTLCNNVKTVIGNVCKNNKIKYFMINCRVTQTYDAGCVIYFYLAFNYNDIDGNPVELHHLIENEARDEIISCGGSISHHHGIGKLRKKWYKQTVSNVGVQLFLATKKQLDPNNIFATNNLVLNSKL